MEIWKWVSDGTIFRSTFRITARRTAPRRLTCASAGCAAWRTFITPLRSNRSSTSWRRQRIAIGASFYLDVLGPARTIDLGPSAADTAAKYPLETARVRRVLETVAAKSGWASKKSSPGHGYGIAVHRSFLTYVAAVVEVKVDSQGKVTIPRVDIALDTGKVIHPDRVRAQFEGAVVFGTSIAMMGEITAKDGRIQQSNFNNYPVARMPEAPYETHVHIVDSDAPPAGVGEPGVPVMAPAICNAIFAATGKRIRELPVRKQKLA